MPEPFAVAVLVRSAGEPGLQGLRCGLSLSLGDRAPRVFLVDAGCELLASAPGSEAAALLNSLVDEVGVELTAESGAERRFPAGVGRRSRAELLREAAAAAFQQVF